jgi:hypothetical protein
MVQDLTGVAEPGTRVRAGAMGEGASGGPEPAGLRPPPALAAWWAALAGRVQPQAEAGHGA